MDEQDAWDWVCDYAQPLPWWWWVIVVITIIYLGVGLVNYLSW